MVRRNQPLRLRSIPVGQIQNSLYLAARFKRKFRIQEHTGNIDTLRMVFGFAVHKARSSTKIMRTSNPSRLPINDTNARNRQRIVAAGNGTVKAGTIALSMHNLCGLPALLQAARATAARCCCRRSMPTATATCRTRSASSFWNGAAAGSIATTLCLNRRGAADAAVACGSGPGLILKQTRIPAGALGRADHAGDHQSQPLPQGQKGR